MKFKVGDRVRVVKCETMGSKCPHIGKIGTIVKIDGCAPYLLDLDPDERWLDKELELVQFTKSDLKDGDIVTYRYGDRRTLIKNTFECHSLGKSTSVLEDYNEDLTMKNGNEGMDIIKIERPAQYETVFERKEEILDETEKRYLRGVIRPFRDKVKFISKESNYNGTEYIEINLEDSSGLLPDFEEYTMYKNMKVNKEYTLEELEL